MRVTRASITAILALAVAACGDDGAGLEDGGADTSPADSGSVPDGSSEDGSTPDSSVVDTGPDPRCPGPTCPTDVIALDGFEIGKPCALRRDGELFCIDGDTPTFTPAGSYLGGVEIARGSGETCVLFESHIVRCFRPGMAPYEVSELYDALDIDTWADHTCVVRPDRLTCWGDNSAGQIEPGGSARYPTMHDVPTVTEAIAVATSAEATCALLRDRTVVCVGNDFGSGPTAIDGITDSIAITGGQDHFCVTNADGTVQCFGDADAGEEATVPDGIDDAEEAIAFHGETCVRHASGQVSCWGEAGVTGQTTPAPLEPIVPLSDAVLLANHCALRASGAVSCWTGRDALVETMGL